MSIHHLRFSDLKGVQRGQDIVNYPIVHSKLGALNLKSGITRIPLGAMATLAACFSTTSFKAVGSYWADLASQL